MARKLVICTDGTWNDPASNTNVSKLKNWLARSSDQEVYYDPGVGTERIRFGRQRWVKNVFDSVGGGAFGAGLSGNVQEAYRWIAETYESGDELWFFGFSRGAFTARSTVGFIRKVGLLRPPIDDRVLLEAYNIYRTRDDSPDSDAAVAFRSRYNTRPIDRLTIAFLGVWDTVGALGVPGRLAGHISRKRFGFHDHRLSSHVKRAYQALAADELRAAYLPTLWLGPTNEGQEVEQAWFPGRHSEVGGEKGATALRWLVEKAEAAGLQFDPPSVDWLPADSLPLNIGELTEFKWRLLSGRAIRPIGDPRFANQRIHPSLQAAFDGHGDYRRENIVAFLGEKPLTAPAVRTWWYTYPGSSRYYLRQYEDAAKG